MSKLWVSVVILALISLSNSADCFGEDCDYEHELAD